MQKDATVTNVNMHIHTLFLCNTNYLAQRTKMSCSSILKHKPEEIMLHKFFCIMMNNIFDESARFTVRIKRKKFFRPYLIMSFTLLMPIRGEIVFALQPIFFWIRVLLINHV